jgi:hypothetical protein
MAETQSFTRRCPSCHSNLVLNARSRGTLQDLCVVLGGELRRCQNCEARHAFLGPFALRLGQSHLVGNHDETNFRIVAIAIFVGVAFCSTVAFMILRRFHHLPF